MNINIQCEIEIHHNIKTLGSSDQLWKSRAFTVYFLIKEPRPVDLGL
jgi:hypothetical protein